MRAVVLLLASLALAGCYVPLSTPGGARAAALYREGLSASGELTFTRRGERAAPRRAAPAKLGVEEAIALAKQNSAKLAEASARVDAASAGIEKAGQYDNPELQVNQLRLDQVMDGQPRVKPILRFKPNRPGELPAQMAAARALEAAARADLRAAEIDIENDVRWMFDDLLLLDAEIAAADGFAEAWRTMAARVKERVEQAAGTAIDESSTELYTVHAELIAAELRMRRSNAVGALLDRLGLDPRSTPSLAGDPPLAWPPPRLPAERALVEAALRTSPRIAGAAAAVDGADANAYLERSKRWPWLTFVDLGYEFGPGNPAGRAFTVQAGVEVPLFHTNGGGARAAEANLEARRRALVSQAEDITREVRDKLREVQAAEALVDQFRARALPAFERSTREAQQALDASGINVIRMLTLNERRQFVELRYLGLVRRHRAAVAALRRAVGGPLPAP